MIDDDNIEEGLANYQRKTLTPKREPLDRSQEDDILRTVSKQKFYDLIKLEGINLEIVSNGKRNRNEEFHKFNLFVNKIYNDHRFLMTDLFLYLEEDWFDAKTTANCFNEENLVILREESTIRFHKKSKKQLMFLIDE